MTKKRPRGPERPRLRQLLAGARPHHTVPARMEVLSATLVGCPYVAHGLVGSAAIPEHFTASLEGFDCVTYVETVLALARASDAAGFAEELRRIRYEGGEVEWARRNHYMTDWVRRTRGPVSSGPSPAGRSRRGRRKSCTWCRGLPPRKARFSCVPKAKLGAFEPRLKNGDIVLFASTKTGIDVFHCGLLVQKDGPKLRHASQSAVVETDLAGFLKANRTSGLVVVRPLDVAGAASKGASASVLHPMPASSDGLEALLSGADSGVLFLADPRVTVTPGPRLFERMTQVLNRPRGRVYSDAVGHARIDYRPGEPARRVRLRPGRGDLRAGRARGGLRAGAPVGRPLRPPAPPLKRRPVVRIPEPLYAASLAEARPSSETPVPRRRPEKPRLPARHGAPRHRAPPPDRRAPAAPVRAGPPGRRAVPRRGERRHPGPEPRADDPRRRRQRPLAAGAVPLQCPRRRQPLHGRDDGDAPGGPGPAARPRRPGTSRPGHRRLWTRRSSTRAAAATPSSSISITSTSTRASWPASSGSSNPARMRWSSSDDGDFALNEIPPGLVDHREWTRENGRNNAPARERLRRAARLRHRGPQARRLPERQLRRGLRRRPPDEPRLRDRPHLRVGLPLPPLGGELRQRPSARDAIPATTPTRTGSGRWSSPRGREPGEPDPDGRPRLPRRGALPAAGGGVAASGEGSRRPRGRPHPAGRRGRGRGPSPAHPAPRREHDGGRRPFVDRQQESLLPLFGESPRGAEGPRVGRRLHAPLQPVPDRRESPDGRPCRAPSPADRGTGR